MRIAAIAVAAVVVFATDANAAQVADPDLGAAAAAEPLRNATPVLLAGLVGFATRRRRHWTDDPELLEGLRELPDLPQDFTYGGVAGVR